MRIGGRLHAAHQDVVVDAPRTLDGRVLIDLRAPQPGTFVPAVGHGDLVQPGHVIGELIVLGRPIALVAARVGGLAVELIEVDGRGTGPRAVGYGERLFAIDPDVGHAGGGAATAAAPGAAATAGGLVFTAPISGRFFAKPGPGKPPFVTVGATIDPGATVCMLEVMKTFNRVTYGGAGLPERARVVAILVEDEADVTMGQPILQVEAAT